MDNNKSLLERYSYCIEEVDPHNKIAGFGRTILAIGTLLTFLFTPMSALFYQSSNYPEGVICSGGYSSLSLFCTLPPHTTPWAYIIVYLILGSVIIGLVPFLTSLLHFWVAWSFCVSSPVIDGGDQIAWMLSIIFILLHFGDLRLTHWSRHKNYQTIPRLIRAIWWSAIPLFILQAVAVYLHACIGKLFVDEWANGTDIWYWLNDPVFSPPTFIKNILLFISDYAVGTVLLNYGVLALEFILAIGFLFRDRLRIQVFYIGVLLHVAFAICFGLWSFLFSMTALLLMHYLYSISLLRPDRVRVHYTSFRGIFSRLTVKNMRNNVQLSEQLGG